MLSPLSTSVGVYAFAQICIFAVLHAPRHISCEHLLMGKITFSLAQQMLHSSLNSTTRCPLNTNTPSHSTPMPLHTQSHLSEYISLLRGFQYDHSFVSYYDGCLSEIYGQQHTHPLWNVICQYYRIDPCVPPLLQPFFLHAILDNFPLPVPLPPSSPSR